MSSTNPRQDSNQHPRQDSNLSQEQQAKLEVLQSGFARKVLNHWQEFRPKMCKGLAKQSKLYQAVWAATTRTLDMMQELQFGDRKLAYDQAQELAYREWYLLPDEKDQPSLTFNPSQLHPVWMETSD